MKYADVVINLPVKNLFKQFTYFIGDELDFVDEGWRVIVPFGHQMVEGFVVRTYDRQDKEEEIKEIIDTLDKSGYIPVISPVAVDEDGNAYNINADYVAGEIAGVLNAFRLLFLTDVDGILTDHNDKATLIPEISSSEVMKLINNGIITGGMLPKVNTCLNAVNKGVKNVIILNGKVKHSILLELFTYEGFGTMIKSD